MIGFADGIAEVSIHAPRCRGAKRCRSITSTKPSSFQSTPPVAGERSNEPHHSGPGHSCFNPRPPLPGSEASVLPRRVSGTTRFQSTPPVAGERSASAPAWASPAICFNPRPPLPGSEAIRKTRGLMARLLFQSTPPVAGERSYRSGAGGRQRNGFNPRPPLPGSEASFARARGRVCRVSIHAPRCRGAKPLGQLDQPQSKAFQSTPPVAGERSPSALYHLRSTTIVSIHAPRCRGAKRRFVTASFIGCYVSIHAPRCRGAKLSSGW